MCPFLIRFFVIFLTSCPFGENVSPAALDLTSCPLETSAIYEQALAAPVEWGRVYLLSRKRSVASVRRRAENYLANPVTLNEKLQTEYDRRWNETQGLVRDSKVPPAFRFENRFDVYLRASAQAHAGQSDFSYELLRNLTTITSELKLKFPELDVHPSEDWHSTQLSVFQKKPMEFFSPATRKERLRVYRHIDESFARVGPWSIDLRGLSLMPDGTVIAQGFVRDDKVQQFRDLAAEGIQDPSRKQGPFVHMTLARWRGGNAERLRELFQWMESRHTMPLGEFHVEHPELYATSNTGGLTPHREGQYELKPFNKELRRIGDRYHLRHGFVGPEAMAGIAFISLSTALGIFAGSTAVGGFALVGIYKFIQSSQISQTPASWLVSCAA